MIEMDVTGAEPVPERPRRRPRWYWGGGGVLLAAAIAIAVIGIGPAHAPRPVPPPPPPPTSGPLGWVEKMVDAPTRGNLAGDETFTKPLIDQVTRLVRGSAYSYYTPLFAVDGKPHPEQEVRLLFAADIATQRVAVLALRLPAVVDDTLGRTTIVALATTIGMPADALVSGITGANTAASVTTTTSVAQPFTLVNFGAGSIWIGLAPPQCTVATATDPDARDFRDEPTGSYLLRTASTRQPGYWRVTCDGVVKQEMAAQTYGPPPTDADVAAFIAGSGVEPPPSIGKISSSLSAIGFGGDIVTGPPRLLWAGPVREPEPLGMDIRPGITVVAAPAVRVGWVVLVGVWDNYSDLGTAGYMTPFTTPTDPANLLAFALHSQKDNSMALVVVAPPGTTSVHVLAGSSSIVDVPVVDRLAVVPAPAQTDLRTVRVQAGDGPIVPLASDDQTRTVYHWE